MDQKIVKDETELRLHKYIRIAFPMLVMSKSQSHDAFKNGQVLVNGKIASEGTRLKPGDLVQILRSKEEAVRKRDAFVPLKSKIVMEDDHVCVAWKPSGLATSRGDERTFELGLAHDASPSQSPDKLPAPVCLYSVDNSATGLVIASKTSHVTKDSIMSSLEVRFRALVHGLVGSVESLVEGDEFVIDTPINGEPAITKVKIITSTPSRNSSEGFITTIDATPVDGLFGYQVRYHLHSIQHPVIGIGGYAKNHRSCQGKGTLMSLIYLSFIHPVTGETVKLNHEEPPKFESIRLKELKFFKQKSDLEQEHLERFGYSPGDASAEDNANNANPIMKNAAYTTGRQVYAGRGLY
ncbi:hypothetical protein HDU97_000054 [Phlyctochytrium planicorne]|nr:hypothetical protein HDU97_000054 [Phlyctochytrium planicorne]